MQRIDERSLVAATKPGLILLDTPELNAETPPHLLDDDITPIARLFARNTGAMPVFGKAEIAAWTLRIDGFVDRPDVLPRPVAPRFRAGHRHRGDGMRRQRPRLLPRSGRRGAVEARRGRLRALDRRAARRPAAQLRRAPRGGLHRPPQPRRLSRRQRARDLARAPIAKALAPETLVAYAINGEPLPPLHGGPLRVVAPGYPGAAFQKWITRIEVRDREHDGERMRDGHYRMPRTPLRYGEPFDPETFEIITDVPVRALITSPREGFALPAGQPVAVRGHAWSGHVPVAKVELSLDGGGSWQAADLQPATERFAWRRFAASFAAPPDDIEIVARATDAQGRTQPLDSAPWNPRGYGNNCCHRVRGRINQPKTRP